MKSCFRVGLLVSALFLAGCAHDPVAPWAKGKGAEAGQLAALSAPAGDQNWLRVVNGVSGQPQCLLVAPDGTTTSLAFEPTKPHVRRVLASPCGRFLAVESDGEGHAVLDLFELPVLAQGRGRWPLRSVDPYPGDVRIQEWKNGQLLLQSDALLTHAGDNGRVSVELTLFAPELFGVEPATGKVTGLDKAALDRVEYYSLRLTDEDREVRGQAVAGLRGLRTLEAVPKVRAALAQEPDMELRQEMVELLHGLGN